MLPTHCHPPQQTLKSLVISIRHLAEKNLFTVIAIISFHKNGSRTNFKDKSNPNKKMSRQGKKKATQR